MLFERELGAKRFMALFGKKKQSIDLLSEKDTATTTSSLLPIVIGAGLIILLQAIASGAIFVLNYSTKNQIDYVKIQEQQDNASWQQLSTLATKVKTIIAKDNIYQTDLKAFSGLDTKLGKIRSLIPDGVTIDQITLDNKGKTTLSAHSAQAADGYQLATVVEKNSDLSNVSLDGVNKQGGSYKFTITFQIK